MNRKPTPSGQDAAWSEDAHQRSKQPATAVAGPYGHPFHPILVTLPIGSWVAALVFDIVALVADDPEPFAVGATWLVGIGLVGAILAAIFGLMDLSRLARGTPARRIGLTHMGLNLGAVAVFAVSLVVRLVQEPDDPSVVGLILVVVGLGILGVSGWLGGKLAYTYGVRVADEQHQRDGFRLDR
jgi:uncharacterized membrane protein